METKCLTLTPHTPAHLRALLSGREAYEREFGLPLADGLAEYMKFASPEWVKRIQRALVRDEWADGFAMVHKEEQRVIGICSYVAAPDTNQTVEIAYGVAPAYEGKGLATEAALAMVDYAFSSGAVKTVIAHTLPERNASAKVLTKCGFEFAGEINHPEDGRVWRWEIHSSPAN